MRDLGLAGRACEHCGKEYTPRRLRQRYCGAVCRKAAYNGRRVVVDVEYLERLKKAAGKVGPTG